jgi:hypothetical protein
MPRPTQQLLFPDAQAEDAVSDAASSTFVNNLSLPVHRWFRYSAADCPNFVTTP